MAGENRLKFCDNQQLREEIAYTVGADPTRYTSEPMRNLNKNAIQRAATQLQPPDDEKDIVEMDLGDLYEAVCEWSGTEYVPNAGNPWGLRREQLKVVHQALDARAPREIVVGGDDGN